MGRRPVSRAALATRRGHNRNAGHACSPRPALWYTRVPGSHLRAGWEHSSAKTSSGAGRSSPWLALRLPGQPTGLLTCRPFRGRLSSSRSEVLPPARPLPPQLAIPSPAEHSPEPAATLSSASEPPPAPRRPLGPQTPAEAPSPWWPLVAPGGPALPRDGAQGLPSTRIPQKRPQPACQPSAPCGKCRWSRHPSQGCHPRAPCPHPVPLPGLRIPRLPTAPQSPRSVPAPLCPPAQHALRPAPPPGGLSRPWLTRGAQGVGRVEVREEHPFRSHPVQIRGLSGRFSVYTPRSPHPICRKERVQVG